MTNQTGIPVLKSILGNHQKLDGGSMFGNVPRAVWQTWLPPDELGRVNLACRALLIQFQGKNILLETGIGAFFAPKLKDRFGVVESEHCLIENLKKCGLEHTDIDHIVLSHLHFDHAGGLLPDYDTIQKDGYSLLFPNATYWVGKEAWERAIKPHFRDRASFIPELVDLLQTSQRLCIVEGETHPDFFPENMRFILTHGHTPGQMHTLFSFGEHKVFFAGDLIPGRAWVHLPVTMGYDRYPELLIDEKQKLYDTAVQEKWLLYFTHDPECAAAYIQQNSRGKFETTEDFSELTAFKMA